MFAAGHTLLSPPLWGRGGEGGGREFGACGLPLSLALPHKGGGNGDSKPGRDETKWFIG
jgi:hypothetical protein